MGREHHEIRDPRGRAIGYLAPTVDVPGVWSVYDIERKRVAMVSPSEDGRVRVVLTGAKDGLEYKSARALPQAVALALSLDRLPRFEPPLP